MRLLAQFVLVVASLALLTTAAHAQTIDACVMKNGILKVLDDGAECLPQETPITLGQPQPAVETVRVFDGNGRDIGAFVDARFRWISTSLSQVPLGVLLSDVGAILLVNPETGQPADSLGIRFSELDCMGRAYANSSLSNILIPNPRSEGSWLIGSKTEVASPVTRSYITADKSCRNLSYTEPPSPSVPVEDLNQDLGVTFPLPLPLWIGSSLDSP
jgi:hypothetical protein